MGWRRRARAAKGTTHELDLQAQIVEALNQVPGVWAMQNQRGFGKATGGLDWPGSSDIIGIVTRAGLGVFFALEVKLSRVRGDASREPAKLAPKPEQEAFLARVREMGGIDGVVHSIEEAFAALGLTR